nr:unnamed protein product [Digitaria exilis]
MSASREPHAWRSGHGQGPGGEGWPYLRNSITCAPLHRASVSGGRWLRRYCRNVFQSRRFCDSYLLSCCVAGRCSGGAMAAAGASPEPPMADDGPGPDGSMQREV